MSKFVFNIVAISVLVIFVFFVMLICLPMDKDDYLLEYNKKIEIIKKTPGPRLIFIGPSTLAFGIDSKQISDSLGINVINMGLHAGIGARYYIDDYLHYVREDDIVLISPSYYGDFLHGGNGFPETMPDLMIATGWRNIERLNYEQLLQLFKGTPFYCLRSLMKLRRPPMEKFNPMQKNQEFRFVASGFNEYGDEISHWIIPSNTIKKENTDEPLLSYNKEKCDSSFLIYLKRAVEKYLNKGAKVLIMPELCSHTNYVLYKPAYLEEDMLRYGLVFFASPSKFEFHDSLSYNGWGAPHLSRAGVTLASERLVSLLRNNKSIKSVVHQADR